MEFHGIFTPFQRRLQMMAIFIWGFLAFIIPFGGLMLLGLLLLNFALPFIYIGWIYYDRETRNKGGRSIDCIRNLGIWKYYKDYFPLKLIKTADLDPKRNYLMCAHPHGMFCNGPFGCFGTGAMDFNKLYPKMTPHLLTVDTFFMIPFAREFFLTFGAIPATKKSMTYILSYPGGGKVGVLLPGGLPEMLSSRLNTNTLYLASKKGFIKLALQNGSPLVPVYSFGETNVYDQLLNDEGSLIKKIQVACVRAVGFYLPVVNGRGILQYSYGILPNKIPITTVVGAPIEVEKTPQPTQEQIDTLHSKYVDALTQLFYAHRESAGYGDAELEIV
jgi:hypothetical protein